MTGPVAERFGRLADSLTELKERVRAALATELASAVGSAVRDVLVVALLDRLVAAPTHRPSVPPIPRPGAWRTEDDRDPWDDPEEGYEREGRRSIRYDRDAADESGGEVSPAVPTVTAVAAGVAVGRWWLARRGTVAAALGAGVLATALGLAGGPLARVAVAVLVSAADVLSAECVLARSEPA